MDFALDSLSLRTVEVDFYDQPMDQHMYLKLIDVCPQAAINCFVICLCLRVERIDITCRYFQIFGRTYRVMKVT